MLTDMGQAAGAGLGQSRLSALGGRVGGYRVRSPHEDILLEASLPTLTPIIMALLVKLPFLILSSLCILLGNCPAPSAARL